MINEADKDSEQVDKFFQKKDLYPEKKKMSDKTKTYLIIIFVGICILAFIFILLKLVQENNECVRNPFIYGANNILKNSEGEFLSFVCSCDVGTGRFYFDREGMYKDNPLLN